MIVNREEFIKILNSDVDINWEQTARDNISIIFKLYDKLEKIKGIIKTNFEEEYMDLGFKEYDCIIEEIKNIIEGAEDDD